MTQIQGHRKGRKVGSVLALLLAFALVASACSSQATDTTTTTEAVTSPEECDRSALTIGYATKSATNQGWIVINAGANQAAADVDATLVEVGPSNENDITSQIPVIEDLINRGVDALAIAPTDSAGVVPTVERANEAGIPVIAIDTAIEGGDVTSFVATNNLKAATVQGELVGDAIGGQGKVIYVAGSQAQQTGRDRRDGFVNGITAKYPDIVVLEVATEWDATAAQNGVQDLVNANPDVAAIAHAWDGGTMATLPVVESAGIDPYIAGFDGAPNAIAALIRGEVDLIVAQSLYQIGYDGIKTAIAAACGEPVEARVNTGEAVLTADTVDAFIASNPPMFKEFVDAEM